MTIREKHWILRAHALALRDRARRLEAIFTEPGSRRCAEWLRLRIEEELEWLDRHGDVAPLPILAAFLPGTSAAVGILESVLVADGSDVPLRAVFVRDPRLQHALELARAESGTRDVPPPRSGNGAARR